MKLLILVILTKYVCSNFLPYGPVLELRSSYDYDDDDDDDSGYRLPRKIKPTHYELTIEPDFQNDSFSGKIFISVISLEESNSITIHQDDLFVEKKDVEVVSDWGEVIKVVDINNDTDRNLWIITLATKLKAYLKYTIKFQKYGGKLRTDNTGFYLAYFTDRTGQARKFATTMFEPIAARRAFPCFDEPGYKATFDINIVRPNPNYTAISNTKKLSIDGNTVKFKTSPTMSTYLVAFVVSEMTLDPNPDAYRVLAKPQDIDAGHHQYALQVGSSVMKRLENYLDITYDLEKIDQVAIPGGYFRTSAMENWGMVTYRDSMLLSSNNTTAKTKQRILRVIAHEFSHQWFGNLVSPAWWTYVWLSEGMATYFENLIADLEDPSMDVMNQFVVQFMQKMLYMDSTGVTKRLNMIVETPNEIWTSFNSVAYRKGAAIIRMMDGFLTTPLFKKGITNYLRNRAYDVANPLNLYNDIQEVLDPTITAVLPESLKDIMSTWDSVPGYPIVTVTRNYRKNESNVLLSQAVFLLHDQDSPEGEWKIPINFASANYPSFDNTSPDMWLTEPQMNATIPYITDKDWIIANKKQTGYYRVNYDDRNWGLIRNALLNGHSKIHVLNRAQIIDDTFMLARSGHANYYIPISISTYLKKEQDYVAFYPFFRGLKHLHLVLHHTNFVHKLQRYVGDVLNNIYHQLHFNESANDKHTDILNRNSVVQWMCKMGLSECRLTCLRKFRSWKNGGKISMNLESSLLCGAMRVGSIEDYNFLYARAASLKDDDHNLKQSMITALGCSENKGILNKYLHSALKTSSFAFEDVISAIYKNSNVGIHTVLDFLSVEKNFKKFQNKSQHVHFILCDLSSYIYGNAHLQKLRNLSHKHDDALFERALDIANENNLWLLNRRASINSALDKVLKNP